MIEGSTIVARCDGCGAPMLTVIVTGRVYECSLYYATLRRTRPLKEGHEVTLSDGKKVELREAPGFCSQQCFALVTVEPASFIGTRESSEGPWFSLKGWEYTVVWDNRTEIHDAPPLVPSVLTFVRRQR